MLVVVVRIERLKLRRPGIAVTQLQGFARLVAVLEAGATSGVGRRIRYHQAEGTAVGALHESDRLVGFERRAPALARETCVGIDVRRIIVRAEVVVRDRLVPEVEAQPARRIRHHVHDPVHVPLADIARPVARRLEDRAHGRGLRRVDRGAVGPHAVVDRVESREDAGPVRARHRIGRDRIVEGDRPARHGIQIRRLYGILVHVSDRLLAPLVGEDEEYVRQLLPAGLLPAFSIFRHRFPAVAGGTRQQRKASQHIESCFHMRYYQF